MALSYRPEIFSAPGPFLLTAHFFGGKILVVEDQAQRKMKSIRVEVVQRDSFGRNSSEPRIYSQSSVGEYIECRERCQDGGFRIGEVLNEIEKCLESYREVTAYCLGP
jgi:hypothetical protein